MAKRKRRRPPVEVDYDDILEKNPAKTVGGKTGKSSGNSGSDNFGPGNRVSKTIGMILCVIQLVASVVFVCAIITLNMLPDKYLFALVIVLGLLVLIIFMTQLLSRKKGIAGKIISVILSIVLIMGSFYVMKTSSTVKTISGGDKKIDSMVVVVLQENTAEKIDDTKDYNFGVQYSTKGEQVEGTVNEINSELGTEIRTTEYQNLNEQAVALMDGSVQAIIYNSAYDGMLEEANPGYKSKVKTIFTYDIESALENTAAEVQVEDQSFVVYISGIDVYGAIETNSRSDVNILAVVNPTSHQVLLVTTPRDFYVEIPDISGGEKDKLTHAGIYGVDASMATLSRLYDTEISFYARVNFTSLIDMVNALGGVDVYSEYAFTTSSDSELVMDVAQGVNHFNGEQALAFSRERQNLEGGDFQRGKNQQAVIKAMIEKAVSPAILTGASGILQSVSGNVDTNMSQDQIQELIKKQLGDGASWDIQSLAAEGTGDQQYTYSMPGTLLYVTQPNEDSVNYIKSAIDAVEQGQPIPAAQ